MRKITSKNFENEEQLLDICPMHNAMKLLSGRWKIALIYYIQTGHNRFGLLQKKIPPITTKMLSQQLKELEKDKLITRKIFAEMPPRVEYSLTEKGKSLVPIFKQLYKWSEKQMANL